MKCGVFEEFIYLSLSLAHFILCISIAAGSLKCCDWPAIKQYSPVWIGHQDWDCWRKWSSRLLPVLSSGTHRPHQQKAWFKQESKAFTLRSVVSGCTSCWLTDFDWSGLWFLMNNLCRSTQTWQDAILFLWQFTSDTRLYCRTLLKTPISPIK